MTSEMVWKTITEEQIDDAVVGLAGKDVYDARGPAPAAASTWR